MSFKLFKKKRFNQIEEMLDVEDAGIEKDEKDMIKGIFGLGETPVKSIMVPRTDVVAISVDEPKGEVLKKVVQSGHSRIPVYEGTIDNVIGFLYVKDLLTFLVKGNGSFDIKKMLRPVLFVPEGKKIDELLKEFQNKKTHIAVVVDEYGGMSGIVCLEDILEEIVGEIQDEYDNEEEEIKKLSEDTFLCDARVLVSDINEELGLELPVEKSETLGGFVFNLFGKIPQKGEKISYNNVEFTIERIDGRKIKRIKVRKVHDTKTENVAEVNRQ